MVRWNKCPGCGITISRDHDFCPNCGEPWTIQCPNCGATWRFWGFYKFCDKCGVTAKKHGLERGEARTRSVQDQ